MSSFAKFLDIEVRLGRACFMPFVHFGDKQMVSEFTFRHHGIHDSRNQNAQHRKCPTSL